MVSLYQCSYCDNSYYFNSEREKHEEICEKNGKTEQERFASRKNQQGSGKITFATVFSKRVKMNDVESLVCPINS